MAETIGVIRRALQLYTDDLMSRVEDESEDPETRQWAIHELIEVDEAIDLMDEGSLVIKVPTDEREERELAEGTEA